mmetsp:Transcript_3650/g.9836  ORF Transcript_3650/g.9836 Transcript_3650/m.9836 type:complete len:92 (-) Transcript_3650:152-427(-)
MDEFRARVFQSRQYRSILASLDDPSNDDDDGGDPRTREGAQPTLTDAPQGRTREFQSNRGSHCAVHRAGKTPSNERTRSFGGWHRGFSMYR